MAPSIRPSDVNAHRATSKRRPNCSTIQPTHLPPRLGGVRRAVEAAGGRVRVGELLAGGFLPVEGDADLLCLLLVWCGWLGGFKRGGVVSAGLARSTHDHTQSTAMQHNARTHLRALEEAEVGEGVGERQQVPAASLEGQNLAGRVLAVGAGLAAVFFFWCRVNHSCQGSGFPNPNPPPKKTKPPKRTGTRTATSPPPSPAASPPPRPPPPGALCPPWKPARPPPSCGSGRG